MNDDIKEEYFNWMCSLVSDKKYTKNRPYGNLLYFLDQFIFSYIIPMDANRYEDGIDLRYRFGYENDYEPFVIAEALDAEECSVLEMMVALALRCEENIMDDPDIGNRTGLWFWKMIENLGLRDMTDYNFDDEYIKEVIDKFIKRKYGKDGRGGLFWIKDTCKDLRKVEIWYQAMWYLNNYIST